MPITIAAVIPAYNLGPYIGRAVESALRQTRRLDEILVVDDGSTDDTPRVLAGYGDRIRVIRQSNAGASAARNAGIQAAQSDWIAFLDGDDEWLPEAVALLEGVVVRHPDLVWAMGNFFRCDCDSGHRQWEDITPPRMEAIRGHLAGREVFDSYFVAHNLFAAGCTDTMILRREAILEAGMFFPGQKRINDMDLWFRVAYRHPPIGFIPQPLAVYHLAIPDSTIKAHCDSQIIAEFLRRHFDLAAGFDKTDDFRPCAAKMLGSWLTMLLDQRRGREVRGLLREFGGLFSRYFVRTNTIKSYLPRLGQWYERYKSH
ncbi:MAG: glycosyltransferase family 2 protein [Phycisphaerae bacterium]|nr:glycosyltransferase family 2 protein [Phycisphaerae bacterium]